MVGQIEEGEVTQVWQNAVFRTLSVSLKFSLRFKESKAESLERKDEHNFRKEKSNVDFSSLG